MKKNIQKLIWIMIKMKLMCLVVALGCTSLNAEVWSQEKKINLQLGEVNLEQLFRTDSTTDQLTVCIQSTRTFKATRSMLI